MSDPSARRYRVLEAGSAIYGPAGEVVELELDASAEGEALAAGLLELLPIRYLVAGGSDVYETPPSGVFEAPVTLAQEELLVAGGHIRRLAYEEEEAPAKQAPAKKAPAKKAPAKRTTKE